MRAHVKGTKQQRSGESVVSAVVWEHTHSQRCKCVFERVCTQLAHVLWQCACVRACAPSVKCANRLKLPVWCGGAHVTPCDEITYVYVGYMGRTTETDLWSGWGEASASNWWARTETHSGIGGTFDSPEPNTWAKCVAAAEPGVLSSGPHDCVAFGARVWRLPRLSLSYTRASEMSHVRRAWTCAHAEMSMLSLRPLLLLLTQFIFNYRHLHNTAHTVAGTWVTPENGSEYIREMQ